MARDASGRRRRRDAAARIVPRRLSTGLSRAAIAMEPIRTDIPARLDRLPWSRFHWLVVFALRASWAIDGLEVTLTGAVGAILEHPGTLHLDSERIGALGSFYLAGAVIGALF